MRTLFVVLLAIMLPWSAFASAERVAVGTAADDLSVQVVSSDYSRTVLRIDIGAFYKDAISIDGETYNAVSLPEEHILLKQGEPALPRICRSIIIPDQGTPTVKIISAEYTDYSDMPVIPSKGNLLRTVDPDTIPYTFGPVYSQNEWYPADLAALREPFILRDYRGTVLELNAFQYQPQSRTLRVYQSVMVEITTEGFGGVNAITDRKERLALVPEFNRIYQSRFINYGAIKDKYTPVSEEGDMLVITYDPFHDAMLPLVEWKQQKGIKTTLVNVSTIGNTSTAIKAYIQNLYNTSNLAWILLVGDAAQVATPTASGGSSDPSYCKLAGGDSYPDAIIGRFSAETVAQVQTQVERTITYENTPVGSDWFHMGTGIGSAEGASQGHNGEMDKVHIGLIRNDLLAFTYTAVDQIYDPGASTSAVTTALNAGRSIINYCGHGSTTAWTTSGFSNSSVNALTNDNLLPFIFSVACVNGDFDGNTCFGEAWLRATHNGAPSGAVAAYMASINQSWVPPMDAQDEFSDLLVAQAMTTFGGICFNGSCKTIDINGADGVEVYDTWHIFGDPSIQVRTDNPAPLSVNHGTVILIGTTEYSVEVAGVPGALCALYREGVIYGSAYTDAGGMAVISLPTELPIGQELTLTVTGFNTETYIAPVTVITPNGPYVLYDGNTIDDGAGNDNGMVDYGENIVLGAQVKNVGPEEAVSVTGQLITDDPYVTITDGMGDFGTVPGNDGTAQVIDAFGFKAQSAIPDGHLIPFTLLLTDAADSSWTSDFSVTAHAPLVEYVSVVADDATGNNNGILDPGETVSLKVTIRNMGSGQADGVAGTLTEDDSYISIGDESGTFGTVAPDGGAANNGGIGFMVTADASCPRGHQISFAVAITGARDYTTSLVFDMVVGDRVPFFTDDFSYDQGWTGLGGLGEWTIGAATGGTGSDSYGGPDPATDHTPTSDNMVLGNDLTSGTGGDYNSSLSTTYWITSPAFDCSEFNGVTLGFWRWLGMEKSNYDHAYLQAYDGSAWVTVYENSTTDLNETAWGFQEYDVSAIADSNPNFQIRFGIGSSDGSGNYCGWNIDDFVLKGYGELTTGQISLLDEEVADSLIPGDTTVATIRVTNLGGTGSLRVRFSPSVSWITC
ncbi:MAG: C25 family cysteine peptidase, partial [candidate division Zixibacteria bacterium]|nr:C25 family cysteine peptidase [candidate division Zixibacteria bacterium]